MGSLHLGGDMMRAERVRVGACGERREKREVRGARSEERRARSEERAHVGRDQYAPLLSRSEANATYGLPAAPYTLRTPRGPHAFRQHHLAFIVGPPQSHAIFADLSPRAAALRAPGVLVVLSNRGCADRGVAVAVAVSVSVAPRLFHVWIPTSRLDHPLHPRPRARLGLGQGERRPA